MQPLCDVLPKEAADGDGDGALFGRLRERRPH
jgi:hypothetical protein